VAASATLIALDFGSNYGNTVATISTAKATLRIIGDSLKPEEVTRMLGATPTTAQFKGEELQGSRGIPRTAKFGMWRLMAAETTPGDLDAQVREILAQLTGDVAVWNHLAEKYEIDLYCGWFMEKENEGLGISATTLRELGVRGIELSLDIYSGDGDTPTAFDPDSLSASDH
jgi:hypothetical protein